MADSIIDQLEEKWPLGVRTSAGSVSLLDENGLPFATATSRVPGSATGQAGAASRLMATLEALEKKKGAR